MTAKEANGLVLVLDHDARHRLRLQVLFQESGIPFPIHFVATPRELFHYLKRGGSDNGGDPRLILIMLDVDAPGFEVDESVKEIKQHPRFSRVPLLLFQSSHPEGDFSGSWLEVGSLQAKPVGLGAILKLLHDQDSGPAREAGSGNGS